MRDLINVRESFIKKQIEDDEAHRGEEGRVDLIRLMASAGSQYDDPRKTLESERSLASPGSYNLVSKHNQVKQMNSMIASQILDESQQIVAFIKERIASQTRDN